MREERFEHVSISDGVRITPACAGRTSASSVAIDSTKDHPRVCGKDALSICGLIPRTGSPPLAREGHKSLFTSIVLIRITPARAGRTVLFSRFGRCIWDHPRSRGKDVRISPLYRRHPGSPPLAREGHSFKSSFSPFLRITPARAGRTGIFCKCCNI